METMGHPVLLSENSQFTEGSEDHNVVGPNSLDVEDSNSI